MGSDGLARVGCAFRIRPLADVDHGWAAALLAERWGSRMIATRGRLITTNDNTAALGFYQRVGFGVAAIHRDAVTAVRRLKPEIPLLGENGVPITDEIELEMIP